MTRWQSFKNAILPKKFQQEELQAADSRGWRTVFDWRPGAFQQEDEFLGIGQARDVMATSVVYACLRLLVWDISKLPLCVKRLVDGIWIEGTHQLLTPLIRKPNYFQTIIDFMQSWLFSYFLAGNAYILIARRVVGIPVSLYVLDPAKCQPLISDLDGAIYYRLGHDPLTPVRADDTIVPASEIIHHRYMAFGHPLIGSSILARAQQAARLRTATIEGNADLAENGSVPPGLLIAPEGLDTAQLDELATKWKNRPKGEVGVVDAAFRFESLQAKFIDSQAAEFAELSAIDICMAFGVPAWKVGAGPRPVGLDIEAANIVYYQDSLQLPIHHIELLIDVSLEIAPDTSVEFDTDALLRMDSKTQADVDTLLGKGGFLSPNEGRKKRNLPPVKGGDTPYLQQQNYSLAALDARDAAAPAPSGASPSPAGTGSGEPDPNADVQATGRKRAALPWSGVWAAGEEYQDGCFVTHKGSLWTLHQSEGIRPGEPGMDTASWSLAAKGGKGSRLPGTEE